MDEKELALCEAAHIRASGGDARYFACVEMRQPRIFHDL